MNDIASLLTHGNKIISIDKITKIEDDFLECKCLIKKENPFLEDDKIYHYCYLEIIAQAVSVLIGIKKKQKDMKIDLNFLLGVRNFDIFTPCVKVGDTLHIEVLISLEEIQEDGFFGIFDCKLKKENELIAKGTLNGYSPKENK